MNNAMKIITGNVTYVPSDYVKYGHIVAGYSYLLAQGTAPYLDKIPASLTTMILPKDENGTLMASFVEVYANSTRGPPEMTNVYGFSIAFLPFIWLVLGITTVVLYFLMLCCRGCCGRFKCATAAKKRTKKTTSSSFIAAEKLIERATLQGKTDERALRLRDKAESERVHTSITQQRKRVSGLFMLFVLIQFAFGAGLTYFSRTFFESAVLEYDVSMAAMGGMVDDWTNKNVELKTKSATMYTAWTSASATCDATSRMNAVHDVIDEVNEPLPEITAALQTMDNAMKQGEVFVSQYLGEYRYYSIYGIGGISIISSLLFTMMIIVGPSKKHSLWRWSTMCGECVICIYTLLAVPLLVLTFIMADICMIDAPLDFLSSQIPTSLASPNVTDIFLTCNNPFTYATNALAAGTEKLQEAVLPLLDTPQVSGSTCPDEYWLKWLNQSSVEIYSEPNGLLPSFVGTKPSINCATFGPYVLDIVDNNVCGSTYNAVFMLTASVTICSFITFLCLYFMPILLSHYDYIHKIWDTMDEEVESDSEDELDADELAQKPSKELKLFEENKEDDDVSQISQVTEFDWNELDAEDARVDARDPHHNPNGKPTGLVSKQRHRGMSANTFDDLLEMEADFPTKVKTIEDIVHYEAINDAGVEDDL